MNINPAIVDSYNREVFTFGGSTSWKTTRSKGYLVCLEWFVGNRSVEPILILQAERGGHDAGALGICLSSIGAYADPSGRPTPEALTLCYQALDTLGKARLAIEAKTLLDVILQFTPDLILMPAAPLAIRQEEQGAPMFEIEVRDENTGKTHSEVSI